MQDKKNVVINGMIRQQKDINDRYEYAHAKDIYGRLYTLKYKVSFADYGLIIGDIIAIEKINDEYIAIEVLKKLNPIELLSSFVNKEIE